jgi:HK97 family phage prohead protease
MEPDFSGYVTKANLQCTDGRTIAPGAFKHQDGARVPVVYNHNHNDIAQHLGYAILSHKDDGVWGDIYLNKENVNSITALNLVKQGALDKFSIWAKNLVEQGALVHSGDIQEVSLVLAGANPGASVYNVLMHSDVDQDDLMIVGGEIIHADTEQKDAPPVKDDEAPSGDDAPAGEKSVAEVLDTLTDEQKLAVNAIVDDIVTEAVTEALTEENLKNGEGGSDAGSTDDLQHNDSQKGTQMTHNKFEQGQAVGAVKPELKHSDVTNVLMHAMGNPKSRQDYQMGQGVSSLRDLVRSEQGAELMHADTYGIDNMEVLFPDAQSLMARPTFVDRRQDWVKTFMSGTSHSPFSRVKTTYADITADEARARGYIKGNQKTEEVFPVFQRETGPAWVIKKQRLDRQDIIDIKDFDVVAWMKAEMRGKLDEEVARAALFGDGRPTMVNGQMNPDKIQDPGPNSNSGNGIRAIINDHELYTTRYEVPVDITAKGQAWNVLLDSVTEAQEFYLGSGNKTAFLPFRTATRLLTIRDDWGKRIYRNLDEVAGDMDVNRIVRVPTELFPPDVLAVVLDLADYNFGTDRGGDVTLFDDFDINFNQYHYLIETYLSGALTLPYSAQVFIAVDADELLATPVKPGFNAQTSTVTIPTTTGVDYTNAETGATIAAGPVVVAAGDTLVVEAVPQEGFYFSTGDDDRYDSWSYESTLEA